MDSPHLEMVTLKISLPNDVVANVIVPIGTTVQQVIEHLCSEQDLDYNRYFLSNGNNIFEKAETVTFEFANYENLKLVKDFRPVEHEIVKVVLQVEDLIMSSKFNLDVTLLEVIEKLVATEVLGIEDITPVLLINKQEFIGRTTLGETTIRSLDHPGRKIHGRFLIVNNEILDRNIGKLNIVDSTILIDELDIGKSKSSLRLASTEVFQKAAAPREHVTFDSELSSISSLEMEKIVGRDRLVFRITDQIDENDRSSLYEQEEEDESFFDLTEKELKNLYKELQKKRSQLENKPLLTKKKREESERRISIGYSKTVIRIQFPDMTVLQGVFTPDETIKDVLEFVEVHLTLDEKFYLFTAPPKERLDPKKSLFNYKLVPTGKLFYGLDAGLVHPPDEPYMRDEVLEQLQTRMEAYYAVASSRSTRIGSGSRSATSSNLPSASPSETDLGSRSSNRQESLGPPPSAMVQTSRFKTPTWYKTHK